MATTPLGTPPAPGGVLHPLQAVAAGWQAFLANPWASLGVLVVLLAISIACGFIPVVNLLASLLVSPAIYAGGAWYFLRGIRRENPPFEAAFEGFQRWPAVTGAVLLVSLVMILITLPMLLVLFGTVGITALMSSRLDEMRALGGVATLPLVVSILVTYPVLIWWSARTGMVVFTVMEADRPSVFDAIKRSLALTRGSVWRLVGLYLLWFPIHLLGLLALCVGLLPAALVCYYSFAHAYEQLRARAA